MVQVLIAMVVSDLDLYWKHRLAHTWDFMWRFHSVHHSVEKLWFFNTGRFHFVGDVLQSPVQHTFTVCFGCPGDVFIYFSSITAFVGLLTHCNVYMHGGVS